VKEAHVYISPEGEIGAGNHSLVYNVEWELPREVLGSEPVLCDPCTHAACEEAKEAYISSHPEAQGMRGTLNTETVLMQEEKTETDGDVL